MIAALIAILFLGGGIEDAVLDYIKYARGTVKEVVADDERLAEARATLKEMNKATKGYSKANQKTFKSLLSTMTEPDTDEEDVNRLWEDYFSTVDAYNEQMIDLRFQLRESLTREEWSELFAEPGD